MTPEQATLVQSTYAALAPRADRVAERFYDELFDLDPGLEGLFKGDMKEQGRKLMQMLTVAVNALCKFYEIVPAVRELGKRHVQYGVRGSDYETVGAALLSTLETELGGAFTDEVKEAWAAAYAEIAETMRSGARLGDEASVYSDAGQPSG